MQTCKSWPNHALDRDGLGSVVAGNTGGMEKLGAFTSSNIFWGLTEVEADIALQETKETCLSTRLLGARASTYVPQQSHI